MILSSDFRPCDSCVQKKAVCLILRSGRSSACIECQVGKSKCNVRGTVKRMIASGELGGPQNVDIEISTVEDIRALGLDRSGELVLSHVVSLRRDVRDLRLQMDEALKSIELRLGKMEAQPSRERNAETVRVERAANVDDSGDVEEDLHEDGTDSDNLFGQPEGVYEKRESDFDDPEDDNGAGPADMDDWFSMDVGE
jgi:hypothetical protein